MSKSNLASDLKLLLNGIQKVGRSSFAINRARCETIIKNSSLRKSLEDLPENMKHKFPNDVEDVLRRASMVPEGIRQFVVHAPKHLRNKNLSTVNKSPEYDDVMTIREEDLESQFMKSLGVEIPLDEEVQKYETRLSGETAWNLQAPHKVKPDMHYGEVTRTEEDNIRKAYNAGRITRQDKENEAMYTLRGKEINDPIIRLAMHETLAKEEMSTQQEKTSHFKKDTPTLKTLKPLSKGKPTSQLAGTSKQRKVPETRISRLVSYGSLAAGLGIGALSEITKRSLGLANKGADGKALLESSPFLTEANAERIVDTLCRVRGAALKIGQILSIQDNSMINPQLQKVFERVRHAADFMPNWQMEKMLQTELGSDWQSKLSEFDPKPFAAASIGQVHLGKLHDGRPVAVKIQYPGVAKGIESDIDNLVSVLNVWKILPDGIFIDSIIEVAKRELGWEVNYCRESECAKRFRKLLENHPDYYVPEVVDTLTTQQVYTTELIEGIAVDKCENLDQESRDRICFLMLDLFFRELFEFRFMQTDPNWSNFLYNLETKQIGLLDFGASREYNKEFVDNYMMILQGGAENDRKLVLDYSQRIGFLTGYESKAMEAAHLETVMILAEAFRIGDRAYDFGNQDITQKIQRLVPIMVRERLCPPPEEIYSLHRKLSGVFLLCTKLRGKVRCRPIFDRVCREYSFN